jgi:hypothetical protein
MYRYKFPIGRKNLSSATIRQLNGEKMHFNDLAFLDNLTESYNKLTAKTAVGIDESALP